ncbi:MAG: DNA polymerase III subunit beta [Parcubacteria group bacterium CG2_30_45_37]|nr:MAG: DNA polymerase III subunit beta [Parcubacteria group bacterium CG2_30_45_37]
MKIFSLQENLKQGLALVGHVAGKNINLPILNNILLKAEQGKIRLVATNLEIGITSVVRGKIEVEGAFTANSKIISDCVNLLPNKKIGLEQRGDDLLVDGENYQAKIKGQSAEEFPLIPEVDRKNYFSVPAEAVKKAISQVIFATAISETRLELSGVLFIFAGNNLTIAATDSYRLAEKKIQIKSTSEEEKKIIIPAKTLQELLRVLSVDLGDEVEGGGQELRLYLSSNQILFTYGSAELVSRLIEGQYPDYQQIIPTSSKTKITIDRQELIRAVKLASLFSKTGINDVNLDFPVGKNQVVVSSVSGQTGENITNLAAKVTGDDNSIVVNYRYLLEGLSNIESETVKLEVIDSNTPCVLRPEKDNGYLYIIMPIKQ